MPATSVIMIKLSALKAPAIAAAARSALTLSPPVKFSSVAIGEITGT